MAREKAAFIVLEGADGCGKSTQAARLAAALAGRGRDVLHVREPGSTRLGERVRDLLLDRDGGEVGVRAEALLYMAARAQLVEEVLLPALAAGRTVVCERWIPSTEVYQGVAGELGREAVRDLAEIAVGDCRADLVLILDVGVGQGLTRLSGEPDRMESKGETFHRVVVEAYRELARDEPRTVLVPPGTPDQVAERILREALAHGC